MDPQKTPAPFPSLKGAILLMLAGWGIGLLVVGIVRPFLGLEGTTAVGNIISLGILIGVGLRFSGATTRETLSLRPFPARLLMPIAVMAFSGSVLVAELGNWAEEIVPVPDALRNLFMDILQANSWTAFVQRAALLALMAPITEELMFRGIFQYGLIRNYGPRNGILITAVCFGVFHLIPWQALGAVLIGILLGLIVYRTGSIFAGMALHAIWNFLPLLVLSALPEDVLEGYNLTTDTITHVPVPALLLAAGIFALALRSFWHQTRP